MTRAARIAAAMLPIGLKTFATAVLLCFVASPGAYAATPAFSVHKNGTAQTIVGDTPTKLTWSTEVIDTNANFATDRFTPTVAGNYLIVVSVQCAQPGACVPAIHKNGALSAASRLTNQTFADQSPQVTAIVNMNGTTDYVEAFATSSGNSIVGTATQTYFSGSQIDGAGTGSSQWTTTGSNIYYSTGSVGIGTLTPTSSAVLDLTSTTKGLLLPRLTTSNVTTLSGLTPPDGMMVYDTDTDTIKLRAAGVFVSLGGGSGTTFTDGGTHSYTTDNIAIGQSAAPEASAALEIESTSKGFLPPRMTTAQRSAIASPVEGLIIYNTSMDKLQYYTGSDWANIGSGEEINPSTPLLVGWGRNDTVGAVGNNSTANELYMVSVASPPSNIVRGSGGGYFHGTQGITCLVTSSNQLYCWGRGEGIGDGDATDEFYPKLSGAAYSWNDVSVGSSLSSCGITTANLAYCWGYQQYNALGNGVNSGAYLYTPQGPVGTSAFTWKQLAVGGLYNGSNHVAHVCGIRLTDNRAYCWGNDAYEQLGNGAGGVNNYTATPTVISDTRAWLMLTAGGYHTCGIDTGDDAYCWGQGTNGQLGNNGIAASGVIVAVSGGRSWSSITAGRYHTCGIEKTTQKAFCWGDNGNGQLGTGNVTDSVVPVAVLGAKKWKKLVAGREHTCGIDSTDRIFCWGIGTSGQIGDGDNTDKLVPTLVWGDYTFSDLWLSSDATIALTK